MDTKQLITFVTFAKEKSFTKSSMKLNYAVSTLSEHISSLEAELGVKLVENKGKRTTLTKNGEIFLDYANRILSDCREAQNAMAYLNTVHGPLRVLTSESLGLYKISPIFAKFTKTYPNVALAISIANPNSFFEKLHAEEADIIFCFNLSPCTEAMTKATTIFKEKLVFVSDMKNPLSKKDAIYPSDFRSETFLLPHTDCFYHQALKDMLEEHGVTLKTKMTLDSGSLIKSYVKMGYGISLLPYSIAQEEIQRGELALLHWQGAHFEAIAQMIILNKEWTNPAVHELIQFTLKADFFS